jgi:hypothetical protein
MTDFTVAKLGASQLDPDTRLPKVQATEPWTGDEDATPHGNVAVFGALGVTALPAAADDAGHCEAIIAQDVAGLDSAVLATRDERAAGVTAELKGGETCLHSTSKGYDSRVFCKDQLAAMVVGDDAVFTLDRKNGTATIAIGGAALQIGKDGVIISDKDGNYISLLDGVATIGAGNVMLGKKLTKVPLTAVSPLMKISDQLTPIAASTSVFVDDPNPAVP